MWILYYESGCGGEPDIIGEYKTIDECVQRTIKDFEYAHEECPEECISPKSIPTDIVYRKWSVHDHSFFRIDYELMNSLGYVPIAKSDDNVYYAIDKPAPFPADSASQRKMKNSVNH
jgi:hypothetical protein